MLTQTLLKAVSEPRRQEILTLLQVKGELAVGEIADQVDVTQQAISLHLKKLEEAGLVKARREGTKHLYTVIPEGFKPLQEFVANFWDEKLDKLKEQVEKNDRNL